VLSILTLFSNPTFCAPLFFACFLSCDTASDLGTEIAPDARFNSRLRTNPQFSVIRRKRHVVRTERGNRKLTQKGAKGRRARKTRAHREGDGIPRG
jgi:hypothetical protein